MDLRTGKGAAKGNTSEKGRWKNSLDGEAWPGKRQWQDAITASSLNFSSGTGAARF
jgi:hypothetical protein